MDVTRPRRGLSLGRIILLALLAGIAWCALSLVTSTSSASADDGTDHGSGLLGAASQAVASVDDVLTGTTVAVDQVVTTVAVAVAPAVEPIPAPQPVGETGSTLAQTADQAVATVDTVGSTIAGTATTAVAEAADAGVVSPVVTPVAGLAESVPVVGAVVEQTGLSAAVTGVVTGLDSTVSTVVGTPAHTGSVLPQPPLTGVDVIVDALQRTPGATLPVLPARDTAVGAPQGAVLAMSHTVDTRGAAVAKANAVGARPGASGGTAGSAAEGTSAPAYEDPVRGGSPGGPGLATPGAGAGANGAGGSLAGLAHHDAYHSLHDFTILRTTTDDALPGAPVFDTDVSPD